MRVAPDRRPPRSTTAPGDGNATIVWLRPAEPVPLVRERTRHAALRPARGDATPFERIPAAIAGAPAGAVPDGPVPKAISPGRKPCASSS